MTAAGAEQYQLKDTSSVQEAALEVLRLCTTLQVRVFLSPTELHFMASVAAEHLKEAWVAL